MSSGGSVGRLADSLACSCAAVWALVGPSGAPWGRRAASSSLSLSKMAAFCVAAAFPEILKARMFCVCKRWGRGRTVEREREQHTCPRWRPVPGASACLITLLLILSIHTPHCLALQAFTRPESPTARCSCWQECHHLCPRLRVPAVIWHSAQHRLTSRALR